MHINTKFSTLTGYNLLKTEDKKIFDKNWAEIIQEYEFEGESEPQLIKVYGARDITYSVKTIEDAVLTTKTHTFNVSDMYMYIKEMEAIERLSEFYKNVNCTYEADMTSSDTYIYVEAITDDKIQRYKFYK